MNVKLERRSGRFINSMTKLESITDIRHTLFHMRLLQDRSLCDRESLEAFQEAYIQLLDRFYAENEGLVAPQQYEAAKVDIEYFMQLIDLAYWHYAAKERKKTQGKTSMH